ncbi:MAG TPA: hypothetical protein VHD56_18120 [Tepidisphaeraceae bacterium]|nr:hypothetical protein [Tepidisphaeraceae bacterium]
MVVNKNKQVTIHRSELSLAISKIDGLLSGLTTVASVGGSVGPSTYAIVGEVWHSAQGRLHETGAETWPIPDETWTLGDLIAAVSTLRSVMTSFLTPEQVAELEDRVPFGLTARK